MATNVEPSNFIKYLKLTRMLNCTKKFLCHSFTLTWKMKTGTVWENNSVQRKEFIDRYGKNVFDSGTNEDKNTMISKKLWEWTIPQIISSIRSLPDPGAYYNCYEEIECAYFKLEAEKLNINESKYCEYWKLFQGLLYKCDLFDDVDRFQPPYYRSYISNGSIELMHFGSDITLHDELSRATQTNISIIVDMAETLQFTYGPRKLINGSMMNYIEKIIIQPEEPVLRLISSFISDKKILDGRKFLIILCGSLLESAKSSTEDKITFLDMCRGFKLALMKLMDILPTLVCYEIKNFGIDDEILKIVKPSIMSQKFGREGEFLSQLIAKAIALATGQTNSFNINNIKICKIPGDDLSNSQVMSGIILVGSVKGEIKEIKDAKILVYNTNINASLLIKNTDSNVKSKKKGCPNKTLRSLFENQIKRISDAGINIIATSGKFSDAALELMNNFNIMAVEIKDELEIPWLCQGTNATVLSELAKSPFSVKNIGCADSVLQLKVGNCDLIHFVLSARRNFNGSTVLLRGSGMEDNENIIYKSLNVFKAITEDGRLLPGGGATEIELSNEIQKLANNSPIKEKIPLRCFANALCSFVEIFAENNEQDPDEIFMTLWTAHEEGKKNAGFDVQGKKSFIDALECQVFDSYLIKRKNLLSALELTSLLLNVSHLDLDNGRSEWENMNSRSE